MEYKSEEIMKKIIFLASLIFLVELSTCINITCEFKNDYIHNWGGRYSCQTKKFIMVGSDRKIRTVVGDHLKNQTSANITQYFARGLNIQRFPGGLGDQFKNLEVVRITSCNMRLLLKEDMENLEKLKFLDLVGNKIEKLESNTFENTLSLVEIMFDYNRLQFIGGELLEPLKHIQLIRFGANVCIGNHAIYSEEQLARLKTEIKLKCSDISMAEVLIRFDGLEEKMTNLMTKLDEINKHLSIKKKN